MKKVCLIFGAGEYYAPLPRPADGDYVIAADGGYTHLAEAGLRIDEVIGDFDSAGFVPEHPNVTRLPVEKDDTDMLFAIRRGLKQDCFDFHLYGGTGGRLDHTLANIQCLAFLAKQGKRGFLHGDGCVLTVIENASLALDAPKNSTMSVFALGEAADGVCLTGLKYPLNDARLTPDFPIGVSNECLGGRADISVRSGALLVCFPDAAIPL